MTPLSAYLQVPSRTISVDSLCLVGIATLASAFQLTGFAKKVGQARLKYKIAPPRTDGDESFVRCFRAQQNCLEFYPVFLVVTWMTAIFLHQVPAAVLAMFYMFERDAYFEGYSKNAESRRKPFHRSIFALQGLALLSAVGVFNVLVRQLLGHDLIQNIIDAVILPI